MIKTTFYDHDWRVQPPDEHATHNVLITDIYPVTGESAMMITNSFAGVPIDKWMVMVRHMHRFNDMVWSTMTFVDSKPTKTSALDAARDFAFGAFGVDIADFDIPF